jgi:archaemetzincin
MAPRSFVALGFLLMVSATLFSSESEKARYAYLLRVRDALVPLHKKLEPPKEGDWLQRFHEEGQTFEAYVASKPVVLTKERATLYIQPLGPFSSSEQRVIDATADFLGRYFACPIKTLPRLPLDVVPEGARREGPMGGEQLLTSYILNQVLKPRLPSDAAVMIAFTASDLWPGEGWNFVFGEATLRSRVAVFSIARFGDPAVNRGAFRKCLLRACKVSSHEVGHMFSIPHCTFFECNACGSNSLSEMDRRPLALCPECLAKLCWATGADPAQRYGRLAEFAKQQGLDDEAAFYEKSAAAIEKIKP